jgi:hypothetical protein
MLAAEPADTAGLGWPMNTIPYASHAFIRRGHGMTLTGHDESARSA